MPVLEAMAAGIPTGCSDIEPLAAIAGVPAQGAQCVQREHASIVRHFCQATPTMLQLPPPPR
jgi:hypothetical protein